MSAAWFERMGNFAAALRRRAADDERMRWSRDRLRAYQAERLAALVAHASRQSPFYRELYGGPIDGPVELTSLPTVSKAAMMGNFDRFVTDPRLRREPLLRHVADIAGDERYADDFRVMTSSGSSGAKALYVYDRHAWREGFLPGSLRMSRLAGLYPRLPRQRLVTVAAGDGKHMSFRGGMAMDVGFFRTRRLAAKQPLAPLAMQLAEARPDVLLGYPSVLALLADEQRAGRLDIAPTSVVTSSEVCTPAMAASISAAWGVTPYNCLGLTETGITAVDCEQHAGLHLFEDLCIVEVVDEHGRVLPPRTPGARILVTNLYNYVQPIIRFEVTDLMTIDDAPCACGRTLARIVALDGRSDDILTLCGERGPVTVHPIHLRGLLGANPAVLQYQVDCDGEAMDVAVVLAAGAPVDTRRTLEQGLANALATRGAQPVLRVRVVTEIAREQGPGKLKLVRMHPRAA
jgi:phenylacetate-CoA ligase